MIARRNALRLVIGRAIVTAVVLASSLASIAQTLLAPASDLVADAKLAASTGVPLILLVSLPGCPHCEVVRRSHLLPLLRFPRTGPATKKPVIRQIEMNGKDIMRDFSGRTTTHADFASRYKIRIAPVVMFLDADGKMLAGPLVGSMIPDFYGAYFDAALAEATAGIALRASEAATTLK